ncbi:BLUF domain-containing protein [Plasmodiophora brassicae]|uniref:BLUF domain-containing protein n=1 Tax=Plasmodiophora brassicae TaxID=37360 RepID=A0A0G4IYD4_PLABS|nr:hypothetical protein PBRA_007986 [Plasmodiophora brassicae]
MEEGADRTNQGGGQEQQGAALERSSLLDLVRDGIRRQNESRVARIVLVGELASSNDVPAFVNASGDVKAKVDGKLTGIAFVVNKAAFVVLIEGVWGHLVEYMRGLMAANTSGKFLGLTRVLTSVEDVERMFPIWDLRLKRVPKAEQADFSSDNLEQTAFETVKLLLQLGQALSSLNKAKCAEFLDSQKREVTGSVPTSELLTFYAHHPRLFSMEEYLHIFYYKPVQIELDSDRVYPMEGALEF